MAKAEYKYKLSKKYLSKLRKEWINERWEQYKAELSMKDLGEIYGVDPSFIYRAIKEGTGKVTKLKLKKK